MDVYVIENPVFDKNKENNKNVANWKNEVCNRFVFTIKLVLCLIRRNLCYIGCTKLQKKQGLTK